MLFGSWLFYCLIRVMNGEDSWREFRKLNLHSRSTPRLGRKETAQMTGRRQQEK